MSKKRPASDDLMDDPKYCPLVLKKKRTECDDESETSTPSTCSSIPSTSNLSDAASSEASNEIEILAVVRPHPGGATFSQFRGLTAITPGASKSCRESPLPNFNWANPREVWDLMVHKDAVYTRNHTMLARHPELHPRMRSILLDWLIEVCEVYKLHRETFYLAQDFVDRYLTVKADIPKGQLQLIGITALFIAAKIEEIYPPKLSEFAYVTDGACTESEILDKELIILKSLNWDLSPVTVNSWLNIYLQMSTNREKQKKDPPSLLPEFSGHVFVQVAQLLDLCILDMTSLKFSYSILAASALCHRSSRSLVLAVSGLQWNDISTCVKWMEPFVEVLKESGDAQLKFFNKIDNDDLHNIQIHNIDLKLLEKVQSIQLSRTPVRAICDPSEVQSDALTPPHSSGDQSDGFTPPHSCKKQSIKL